jgi:metal-responsive CopG/Arc/MetJ family transcriptional regulator
MPNQPRPENPARPIRVENDLWEAARVAAKKAGTTRAEVMREALRELVEPREQADREVEQDAAWMAEK